jgi:hypothetical protein
MAVMVLALGTAAEGLAGSVPLPARLTGSTRASAGGAIASKRARSFRPPQVGCAARSANTCVSSAALVRRGECWGRRDRSTKTDGAAGRLGAADRARASHL